MDKQPLPWPPYNTKDCSLAYCSYYCPQYCFFYFPPPAPTPPKLPTHHLLSPLLISVIAISSTAFLFIAYYLILSRYRANQGLSSGPTDPAHPASWPISHQNGLGETLINKIAIHRYRAGGRLQLDGSDCSVCLSQFEDGNDVRLLPKCGHVFHVPCIDTWLKSHSNCPLCRAGIFPEPGCNYSDDSIDIIVAHVETQELELDEVVENVNIGDRRGAIGRSLSMDSSFRRNTIRDTNMDVDAISSRWNRGLHSIVSPVRMNSASSMRSMVEIGRSTLLPT